MGDPELGLFSLFSAAVMVLAYYVGRWEVMWKLGRALEEEDAERERVDEGG